MDTQPGIHKIFTLNPLSDVDILFEKNVTSNSNAYCLKRSLRDVLGWFPPKCLQSTASYVAGQRHELLAYSETNSQSLMKMCRTFTSFSNMKSI